MTKRTSTSYVCTLDVNSCVDMEKLETIKKAVAAINNDRSIKYKKRVVVRGRKPAVKMQAAGGYIHRPSKGLVSYDWAGNIVGGIANATKLDVYIYDRRD